MQVGFIGISNWALDPAKMNRGILVQRAPFDVDELEATARSVMITNYLFITKQDFEDIPPGRL